MERSTNDTIAHGGLLNLCGPRKTRMGLLAALLWLVLMACQKDDDLTLSPSSLVAVSSNMVSLIVGEQNTQTIQVRVLNANAKPMAGVKVYFSITEGRGVFSDSVVVSNADGIASTQMTPGTLASNLTVKVQAEKILNLPVYFYFFVASAAPAKIEVQSGNNQEALANGPLPNQIVVKVSDKFGNPVSNVPVQFKIKSGNGTLLPFSTTTYNGLLSLQFTTGAGEPLTVVTASAGEGIQTDISIYTLVPVQLTSLHNASNSIELDWDKSLSPNFKHYTIYRTRARFNDAAPIAQVDDVNTTTFTDTDFVTGYVYGYYVGVDTKFGDHVNGDEKDIEPGNRLTVGADIDYCLDKQRGIFYVPYGNRVWMVSANNFQKLDSIPVVDGAYRMALSNDGKKLYVVSYGLSFDVIDIATKSVIGNVDLSGVLTSDFITDIYMTQDGQLFAAGDRIVKIDEANHYAATIVASGKLFFPAYLRFVGDVGSYLYVEQSSGSPCYLHKLDISQSSVPLVLGKSFSDFRSAKNAVLSPDGTKVYIQSGQIVNTADFTISATLAQGQLSAVGCSSQGDKLFTSSIYYKTSLDVLDATTLATEKQTPVGFTASQIMEYNNALFVYGELTFPHDQYRFYKIELSK
jgi:hypothetical protein